MHAAGVQDDICALWDPVAVYDVIGQGLTHGEVHHGVEAQALVDEALQHVQLLKVPVLERPLTCSQTTSNEISLRGGQNNRNTCSLLKMIQTIMPLCVC